VQDVLVQTSHMFSVLLWSAVKSSPFTLPILSQLPIGLNGLHCHSSPLPKLSSYPPCLVSAPSVRIAAHLDRVASCARLANHLRLTTRDYQLLYLTASEEPRTKAKSVSNVSQRRRLVMFEPARQVERASLLTVDDQHVEDKSCQAPSAATRRSERSLPIHSSRCPTLHVM